MKPTYYFLLVSTLVLTSCKDDFLERLPQNQVSDATFWKTTDDLYLALNAFYPLLENQSIIYQESVSDNAYSQYPWESFATLASAGDITAATNAGWSYFYIRRANNFLEHADQATGTQSLKDRYKAEARFLRAYNYYLMVKLFGDVPLVTKTLQVDEVDVPRTPRADVITFILNELNEASAVLPAKYTGGKTNEVGRATKGAAIGLRARILLDESRWQEAVTESAKLMDGTYKLFTVSTETGSDLLDNYANWVNFTDAADEKKFRLGLRSYQKLFESANKGNSEVILDRQYINTVQPNTLNTLLPAADLGGWSSVTPTQELVNAYNDYRTGEPITPLSAAQRATYYDTNNPAFANEYKNRDPRFYATILFNGNPWNTLQTGYAFKWVQGGSNNSQTGYNFRKMVDPDAYKANVANYSNIILLRYAEILLINAEARNEVSGPSEDVFRSLDAIRARAGMPPVDRTKYNTQALVRELIRNERRIELVLEGQRYMDIRRWKTAPQVMKNIYSIRNGLAQQRTWTDKLYVMPVPQAQIDLSQSKALQQNSGY
ncbi:RagB/SusD family nutrient uptake outer membrane protein [Spirosoma panaciterrae]|uniref:RagB/SusD family nutrient uptake outer membrane protein n=1 Tax=Spirosoma panaciterrae TaxID=496058 RepID=UPI0003646ACE|nr:RagB/SusD family nutrient uptake outer membrane protein [Spirosoma panaciterrae]